MKNRIPMIDKRRADLDELIQMVEELKAGMLEFKIEFDSKTELRRYRDRMYATLRAIRENPDYKDGKYKPLIDSFTMKGFGKTLIFTQPEIARKQAAMLRNIEIVLPPYYRDWEGFGIEVSDFITQGRFFLGKEHPTQMLEKGIEYHRQQYCELESSLRWPSGGIKVEYQGTDEDGDHVYTTNVEWVDE